MTINSCTFAPGIAIHEMNIYNNKKTMDETVKNEVSEEIEHQGEETQKSPLMLKLDQYRITPDKQLPKMMPQRIFKVEHNGRTYYQPAPF